MQSFQVNSKSYPLQKAGYSMFKDTAARLAEAGARRQALTKSFRINNDSVLSSRCPSEKKLIVKDMTKVAGFIAKQVHIHMRKNQENAKGATKGSLLQVALRTQQVSRNEKVPVVLRKQSKTIQQKRALARSDFISVKPKMNTVQRLGRCVGIGTNCLHNKTVVAPVLSPSKASFHIIGPCSPSALGMQKQQ